MKKQVFQICPTSKRLFALLVSAWLLTGCAAQPVPVDRMQDTPESTAHSPSQSAVPENTAPESNPSDIFPAEDRPEALYEEISLPDALPETDVGLPLTRSPLAAPQELSVVYEYGEAEVIDGEIWLFAAGKEDIKLCDKPEDMPILLDSMVNADQTVALYYAQGELWYQLPQQEKLPRRIAPSVGFYRACADARYVFYSEPTDAADVYTKPLFRFDTQTGETVTVLQGCYAARQEPVQPKQGENGFVPDFDQRRFGHFPFIAADGESVILLGENDGIYSLWAWHADSGLMQLDWNKDLNYHDDLHLDEDHGGVWYPDKDGNLYHWRDGVHKMVARNVFAVYYGNAAGQAYFSSATDEKLTLADAVEIDDPDSPLAPQLEPLRGSFQGLGYLSMKELYYTDSKEAVLLATNISDALFPRGAVLLLRRQRQDFPRVRISEYETFEALTEAVSVPWLCQDDLLIHGNRVFLKTATDWSLLSPIAGGIDYMECYISNHSSTEGRYAKVTVKITPEGIQHQFEPATAEDVF